MEISITTAHKPRCSGVEADFNKAWVAAAVCLWKAPESLMCITISTLLQAQGTKMWIYPPVEAKAIHISSTETGEGRQGKRLMGKIIGKHSHSGF